MFDIHQFMTELAMKRPVFHSEADFQHAFAWQLHEHHPNANIRLEYPIEGMHLDILLTTADVNLAIELKYKTRGQETSHQEEIFYLKNHIAHGWGRYDYLKDITRLESLKKNQKIIEGYAILLTNDGHYWEKGSGNTGDRYFYIHDTQNLNGDLGWYGNLSKGTTKGRTAILSITGNYLCKWDDYPSGHAEKFRYLALKV